MLDEIVDNILISFVDYFLVQIIEVGEATTQEEKEREERDYQTELLSLILD
jgi:large-conductance mechanosensitive channel